MRKLSVLGIVVILLALAVSVYAQCSSDKKEVKVMCISGDHGDMDCCRMESDECCGGMDHGGMWQQYSGHKMKGGCEENFYLCCAEELELSEAQTKRLKEIRFENKKATIRAKADLDILQLELKELLLQSDPDRAAVGKKITDMGALKTNMHKERVMATLNARSVLTADQLKKCEHGHCGCMGMDMGMGMKKVMEGSPCSGSCSEGSKECSGKCK